MVLGLMKKEEKTFDFAKLSMLRDEARQTA